MPSPQALHLFAAGLRQFAREILAALPPPAQARRPGRDDEDEEARPPPPMPAAGHPEAAKALRAAAGVYAYLEANLPELGDALSARRLPNSTTNQCVSSHGSTAHALLLMSSLMTRFRLKI